jgi:hypothetical protein
MEYPHVVRNTGPILFPTNDERKWWKGRYEFTISFIPRFVKGNRHFWRQEISQSAAVVIKNVAHPL